MITNKRFPEFDVHQSGSMEESILITLECYVRVKRKGKHWRVLIRETYGYSNYMHQFQGFTQDLQRFIGVCKRYELFWQLPNKTMIQDMIFKGTLAQCNSHLSNKEEDLIQYR